MSGFFAYAIGMMVADAYADLEHLYLGHVAVEATLLGLVLGATLSVSLGLFTVALCHLPG